MSKKVKKPILHRAVSTAAPNCPRCGAPPSEHEVRDYDMVWHDGNVHCTRCGAYVCMYNAG